jgi:iron complex outermembrane receptor protein
MSLRGFKRAAWTAGISAAAAMAGFSAAHAQVLEEVVVTARARAENVQTVPLAITAFSGSDIQTRAAVSIADIAKLTPGFSFEDFGGVGNSSPVIRGATQIAGSVEQTVSFFLDGVYLPRSYLTDIGFFGLNGVEVVKGPQSARYGRNAFAGAVNYISRKPTEAYHVEGEVTVGNDGRRDYSVLASGALLPGKVSVIAGIYESDFDGSWKNTDPYCNISFSLGTNCTLGGYKKITYNAGVHITPTDKLTIDGTYFNFLNNREEVATTYFGELNANSGLMNCGQYNPNVRPASAGGTGAGGQWYRLYCGALPISPIPVDPRGYSAQTSSSVARASLDYKFTDYLRLSYVFGRVQGKTSNNLYTDFIPGCPYFLPGLCVFNQVGVSSNTTDSHDIRVTFDNGGIFRGSVGYLYSPSTDLTLNAFAAAAPINSAPTTPLNAASPVGYALYVPLTQNLTKSSIYSPFAEGTLSLLNKALRLEFEGRYTQEVRYQQALASGGAGGILAFSGLAFNANYYYFTPRMSVEYDVMKDHMIYASAAEGVKAGGFNTTAYLPANRTYGADSNWTYELGTKNTWGRLKINADVFLLKWKNQQVPAADPGNPAVLPIVITLNLGNVTSKGVEFEGEYAFTDKFKVSGTGYYGKSTYDSGTYDLNFARTPAVCDNVVCPKNGYIGGKESPRAPDFMATAAGDWRDAFPWATGWAKGADYYIHGDLTYQSKAFADDMNLSWVPSRLLFNAGAGLEMPNYAIKLWVRNLFDLQYLGAAYIQQPNVAYTAAMGDRRTFGVTLSAKY